MVEPFLTLSDEDMTKANSSGTNGGNNNNNATNDLLLDSLMDDLFDLGPNPTQSAPTSPRAHSATAVPPTMTAQEETSSETNADSWRVDNPSNAVHMHVQENAKLPSLNFSVDRKKHSRSPEFDGDASKLAESFLRADSRQSFHASYEQAGALSQTTGTSMHGGHYTNIQERRDSLDADMLEKLLADLDPTPLSEIKKRHAAAQHKQQRKTTSQTAVGQKQPPPPLYTRKAMLPIPTEKISPPVSPETRKRQANQAPPPITNEAEPMQSAVATAAELAAARPKPPVTMTKHTPVAIHRTFGQKSQYGFGSNHVVPSVPRPPLQRPTPVAPSAALSASQHRKMTPPPPTMSKDLTGHGDAYERKKQRAKDARVKLNESIERLSVAIALAGTQSKERRQQWQEIPDSPFQEMSMQIMGDCIDTADSAKKWDRPAFVGSAASLVQGLNAQCEAMMREIMRLRQDGGAPPAPPTTVVSTESLSSESAPTHNTTSPPSPAKRSHTEGASADDESPSAKRAKMDFSIQNPLPVVAMDTEGTQEVWSDPQLRSKIVSFLDPLSLLRCQKVNKTWRTAANQEELWGELCTARFGYFNVRQWRAKLDDEEEGIKAQSSAVYRSMDRANVMGNFQHEGLFLLGEARLPNKVSAWVFLVERSNGETMRSVRRKNELPGNGAYTTLPIVELRTVIQNTGVMNEAVIIREQMQSVDASTRRRGEQLLEVDWDDRFRKATFYLDGTPYKSPDPRTPSGLTRPAELCRLRLFESVVLTTFIHAKGCSTNSKFVQRANFTKILVALDSGVTVPLVVPFPRDASHLMH